MKQLYYAIQTIIRGKNSSFVKVVSLSLGLLMSVILFSRVAFELNYDNFYQDSDKLFVVETAWENDRGQGNYGKYIIFPTAAAIAQHFPEQVKSFTTISDLAPSTVIHGTKKYKGKFIMADSLYFQTMGLQLQEGNALDLSIPGVIFLSRSFAKEVFGNEEPLGKTLVYPLWGKEYPITVKGIFADIPDNTSLMRTSAVISMNTMLLSDASVNWSWTGGGNYSGFVRLKHKEDARFINEKIDDIIESKYFPKEHYGQAGVAGIKVRVSALRDYHLKNADVVRMIWIMSLLGFALLLAATLNYALVSISSLGYRAKAVGVHKCNGAGTASIFGMFLWETAFFIGASLLLIAFIVLNFREKIEELTQVSLSSLFSWQNLWAPAAVVLFLFMIGGGLPAVTFSSVPVTRVFRRYNESKKAWKYPLLAFQFGGAAFMVGFMCLVFAQYHYTLSKDLGYNVKNIVYTYYAFPEAGNAVSNLRNLPYVEDVAGSELDMLESRSPYSVNDASGNHLFSPRVNWFSKNFFSFIGLRLKAGQMPVGPEQILVNEEFVKKMGWSSDGVGERVPEHGTVTGVIEGYYFTDVAEMPPFEIRCLADGEGSCVHVRLKEPFDDNLQRLNADIKKFYPQDEIVFRSYDDLRRSIYRSTRIFRDSVIWASIAILAIILMGLIGYTNDEVCRRSKEIAIRKINGAGIGSILFLLARDLTYIAIPSVAIGTLLAWYVGKIWQARFNDVLSVPVLFYIGVILVVLAFIIGSVILKSWKIANENPVNSIKNE